MKFNNMKINKDENSVEISVNAQIFSIPTVMKTLSEFCDNNYVYVEGSPVDEIIIKILPRNNQKLEELAYDFNTKLIKAFNELQKEASNVLKYETNMKDNNINKEKTNK